jgi:hypothetical protein
VREALQKVSRKLQTLGLRPSAHPHGSNLFTKSTSNLSEAKSKAIITATGYYLDLHKALAAYEAGALPLGDLLLKVEDYYQVVKRKDVNVFSHQSDFLSSILPEVFCVLLRRIVATRVPTEASLSVSGQSDVIIECNFDVAGGGRLIEKRKRMDVAVLAGGSLVFNERSIDLSVPAICAEIKTNIDKNMLAGIEASVETLKRTFPRTKYFAIGEYCDFGEKAQNYASTGIDEILILRQQKRSKVRTSGKSNPLSVEVIQAFIEEAKIHLQESLVAHQPLSKRMLTGRLSSYTPPKP